MCMFSISTYTLFFYLCAIHPTPKGVGFSHVFVKGYALVFDQETKKFVAFKQS